MNSNDLLQMALYLGLLTLLAIPTGLYLARVLAEGRTSAIESSLLRLAGTGGEQTWRQYAAALLGFHILGFVVLFLMLRFQSQLPLNPQALPDLSWHLALNTAVSFITNTNWQSYGGESTLSYFSQMAGLTVQNFLSAAVGFAVLLALIRGLVRERSDTLGNFYSDITRVTVTVLLPLSLIAALLLVWQGVPQNFTAYTDAQTLEGAQQVIAQGPVASQIAIKQIGTNGGGFFNTNSAHPFENPTPLSNLLEMIFILWLPAALVIAFGRLVGDRCQGYAIFAAMMILLVGGLALTYLAEIQGNPFFAAAHVTGDNLEGKEVRFGVVNSVIWANVTTAASNGSVNAMHDSFTPLSGALALFNMHLGEVVFGGVGTGLYGMLLMVMLTVFIAGLMVGRTPEYLSKKIEAREISLAVLAQFVMPVGALVLGGLAIALPVGTAGIQEPGPHGLTELLYAYSSATANNGSAFAGFTANTPFHNTMLSLAMLLGRFGVIVPVLAIAGSLAAKRKTVVTAGTFPTHGPLFVFLLIAVVFILGGLSFFPVLVLGPIAEHFAMAAGQLF